MIAHIVLFRPKPNLSIARQRLFAQTIRDVLSAIPTIRRANVGKIVSQSPLIGYMTYTYAAVLEFDNASGLDQYLSDPSHEKLAQIFWESCESTVILDASLDRAETFDIDK